MVWQQCNELVPPLVTPLRAILYMLGLVFIPHLLRVPMYLSTKGSYDNLYSRDQAEGDKLKGNPYSKMIRRTIACHYNSWEALIYFTASALTAHICKLDSHTASVLCTLFLGLRALYIPLYVLGSTSIIGVLRSLVWTGALIVSVRMSLLSLNKAGL